MYSTDVTSQIPARCLFSDTADLSTPDTASGKPSASFSIGDIMKSVGLPVQEDQDRILQKNDSVQTSADVPKTVQEETRSHQTTASTEHPQQRLQMKDLLHSQLNDNLTETVNGASSTNPFLSFLERPSLHETNRCSTPPRSVPLSLQYLKSCPEMSPGLPSTVQQLSPYSLLSAYLPHSDVKREIVTSPRSVTAQSPTSDISEDQLDIESTSPNGSTASSGFCSNPSPTPSGSPPTATIVPANQRTAYNEKQTSRLKQVFQENRYPDVELYEELSEELSIPIQRLRVWFQNRRARNKRTVPDPRIMNCPPHVSAIMSSAPGYGYMTPSPMMHQSLYQYPVTPASMFPMFPPTMYPGYSYPFQYQH